ncbi:copper-binding protein [Comamonas thiooxydans]|nr:copper-binding protein [Comamonas thiooxydans]MPT09146.1 copper-binding protein [Comamonas sp.]QOQ84639.1 copper-binding protein [Comamonas thiooxydans]QQN72396.1 copper-binding protein [Comamonas testosteroni]TFF63375.1 hypothetical protein EIC84_04410 [Comamonas sp. A23]
MFAAAKTGSGCSLPRPLSLYCCHDKGFRLHGSRNLVVLRHGDIPNQAKPTMTMGFAASEKKMLKVGDKVKS